GPSSASTTPRSRTTRTGTTRRSSPATPSAPRPTAWPGRTGGISASTSTTGSRQPGGVLWQAPWPPPGSKYRGRYDGGGGDQGSPPPLFERGGSLGQALFPDPRKLPFTRLL